MRPLEEVIDEANEVSFPDPICESEGSYCNGCERLSRELEDWEAKLESQSRVLAVVPIKGEFLHDALATVRKLLGREEASTHKSVTTDISPAFRAMREAVLGLVKDCPACYGKGIVYFNLKKTEFDTCSICYDARVALKLVDTELAAAPVEGKGE